MSTPPLPTIDWNAAKQATGDNLVLIKDMLKLLRKDLPTELEELRTAFKDKEHKELEHLAHRLQGSLMYCGAIRLKQAAAQLEHAIQVSEIQKVKPLFETLADEIERLMTAIDEEVD